MLRLLVLTLALLGVACTVSSLRVSGTLSVEDRVVRSFDDVSVEVNGGANAEAGEIAGFCDYREDALRLGIADRRSDRTFERFWIESDGDIASRLDVRLDRRTYELVGECPVATSLSAWDDVVAFDCDVVDADGEVIRFAASLTLDHCVSRD